jgi:hypothetical protein
MSPTALFVRDTEIEKVGWRSGAGTVYSAVGDLFAEICFALAAAALLAGWLRPRRQKPLEKFTADLALRNGHRVSRVSRRRSDEDSPNADQRSRPRDQ